MPSDICKKMESDTEARVEWIDHGNGWAQAIYDSKYMPLNVSWKWDEEFEHTLPVPGGPGQKYKMLMSRDKDTIIDIWKGEKFTMRTIIKFTGEWVIVVSAKT